MKKNPRVTYSLLSIMLFLQYMMFAVWWVPLAAYLTNMGVGGTQMALILSSMAIGCLASPMIGAIADKYFASKKVLAFLNFVTALLLFIAARQSNPVLLFLSLLVAMIAYMPTWGLTSAITMAHSPADQFPRIRAFGSIGWVASALFSLIAVRWLHLDFDGTNLPLYCGAGVAFIAALLNYTLPYSPAPARGSKITLIDILGLRTVSFMKDRNFAIFIVVSFLAMIPFTLYWSYLSQFLQDIGFKYITVTMNMGQFAEIFFMLTVPIVLKKAGVRYAMYLGLLALLIRYLSFYIGGVSDMQWLYFVAILVHGIIFGYFFVGGQVYIHKKIPEELNAQAQGFIFLVTFGLGLLVGNFVNVRLIERFTESVNGVDLIHWNSVWGITALSTFVIFIIFMLLFRDNIDRVRNEGDSG